MSWELKLLIDRREDLVGQRVAAVNRLKWRIHQIDPTQPDPVKLHFAKRRRALEEYLADRTGLLAELAGGELADITYFSSVIDPLTKRIIRRIHDLQSSLLLLPGCAELTAAKLISESANIDRFKSEAAFARYVGIAPVPDWSGLTRGRMRATRGGNRQLNTAIHRIAVVQIRVDCPGREYYQRRRAQGDSGATAVRCLKRRLCRVVFNRLKADFARRQQLESALPKHTSAD